MSFLIAIVVVVIDQLMKIWTINNLSLYASKEFIPWLFDFYYLRNEGAAWSILKGEMTFLYVISVLAISYLIYLIIKDPLPSVLVQISYGLLLGGAVGNFIDRVVYGYVIDMIRLTFMNFPVFNMADIALTIGVILMIIFVLFVQEDHTYD